MKAIKINFSEATDDLTGKSKWFGSPDFPEGWEYPDIFDDNGEPWPLTFVCQIRCADIAKFDKENLLPHEGMLYFFAAIDEYMEDVWAECPYHNGLGEWSHEAFKVLYSPTTDNLSPYEITWEDGEPAYFPVEAISFEEDDPYSYEFRLLGKATPGEVAEYYGDYYNLLQIDEEERWSLRLYDMGMLNFLIKPEDLKARRFDKTILYFESC